MPAPVPNTDPAPIFDAIIAKLVAAAVVPTATAAVMTAAPEAAPHHVGDADVLIWPQDEVSGEQQVAAGGREATWVEHRFSVIARSRLDLDESGRDRKRLTHSSRGHYVLRAAVRDALHLFWPEDSSLRALGVQPIRWVKTAPPKRDRDPGAASWVSSQLEFTFRYGANLS